MWFMLGGAVVVGALVAVGWLIVQAVARRMTIDLAFTHEHPMTVVRNEKRCWSCDDGDATSPEGLCAKCTGGLLREASAS